MTRRPFDGREGATLVEVLVASLLLAMGVLIWLGAYSRSMRLIDDAHLGLHAAILLTEASRAPGGTVPGHAVGPGRMEIVEGSIPLRVRYEPPASARGSDGHRYAVSREWSFAP